jgi:hypothetical protein
MTQSDQLLARYLQRWTDPDLDPDERKLIAQYFWAWMSPDVKEAWIDAEIARRENAAKQQSPTLH